MVPLNVTGIVPLKLTNFFSILFENTVKQTKLFNTYVNLYIVKVEIVEIIKITYKMSQNYKGAHDNNLMFLQFLSSCSQGIYTEIKPR